MTPQEAVEIMKIAISEVEWNYPMNYAVAFQSAIEALEKQIQKKPKPSDEQNIRYAMNYICPACGKHFSGTGIADYCYHCGQALDWSNV